MSFISCQNYGFAYTKHTMKKLILSMGLGLLSLSTLAQTAPAMAETFVWTDPTFKVEAAFPDNWMRQANLDEDLRLFILAPQGADHAACRLYIKQDRRLMDAPANAQAAVNQYIFPPEALQLEIFNRPDVNNVRIVNYQPNASLGKGAAVMATAEFTKTWAGQQFPMYAQIFASLYHGKNIVLSCETHAAGWGRWADIINGVVKSIDFPAAWTPTPNSAYRPFQDDGGVILPLNRKDNAQTVR